MARRVKSFRRWLKVNRPDIYRLLPELQGMTPTRALSELKKKRIRPVTRLTAVRTLAKDYTKKTGIAIRISKRIPDKYALGGAHRHNKSVEVVLHPFIQYHPRSSIRNTIGHELDHIKVMEQRIK